jgi:hypothetical protein
MSEMPKEITIYAADISEYGRMMTFVAPLCCDYAEAEYVRKDPATVAVPVEVVEQLKECIENGYHDHSYLDEAEELLQPYMNGEG